MSEQVKQLLARGALLFDGAMGTYYQPKGGGECEQGNTADPAGVLAAHTAYLQAGAMAIKTNTFGLPRMAAQGQEGWQALLAAGWQLAQQAVQAAGGKAVVFADLGPVPDTTPEAAGAAFTAAVDLFIEQGAQNFLFETLSGTAGLAGTLAHLRARCPGAFVLVSFAVQPDGYTREGGYYQQLIAGAEAMGADAVGLNCVAGPGAMAKLARGLAHTKPLAVMPNAGYPTVTRTRVAYHGQPDYFAASLAALAGEGCAQLLGGCCGTTPAHIAALARQLAALPRPLPVPPMPAGKAAPRPAAPGPFVQKLAAGRPVIAVELDPPKTASLDGYMQSARRLQAAGADAITIADSPIARASMDPGIVACKLWREAGITPLPHLTCRDRNLNAIKAMLLGMAAEGVRQVLAVTGDPIPTAERDEVKQVYQFNSRKLAAYIASLAGQDPAMPFTVFGALNLNAANFAVELRRAEEKVQNGMQGFLTQPVLSARALQNLRDAKQALAGRAYILAGIIPVVSWRNAVFMENEVNGIHVCPEIIGLYQGLDRAAGEEMALKVSLAIARHARPYADGFYLITPFNRVALMEKLAQAIRQQVL